MGLDPPSPLKIAQILEILEFGAPRGGQVVLQKSACPHWHWIPVTEGVAPHGQPSQLRIVPGSAVVWAIQWDDFWKWPPMI